MLCATCTCTWPNDSSNLGSDVVGVTVHSPSSERREVGVREGAREGASEGVADGVLPVIPCTNQLEYFWV